MPFCLSETRWKASTADFCQALLFPIFKIPQEVNSIVLVTSFSRAINNSYGPSGRAGRLVNEHSDSQNGSVKV